MTDIEATVEETPVTTETPEEQFEVPDYNKPPQWAEEIHQKLSELAPKPTEDDAWRYDNEKLAEKVSQDLSAVEQKTQAQLGQLMKPFAIQSALQTVGNGLGEKAHDFIKDQLNGLDAVQIAGLAQNKAAMTLLREAAENIHRKTTPASTPAPGAESPQNPTGTGLTTQEEREVDRMYNSFKSQFPTYTREMAVNALKRAKENG